MSTLRPKGSTPPQHDEVTRSAPAGGERLRVHRYRAWVTGLAPVLFLVSILYHPPLGDLRDKQGLADAIVSDSTRWGLAHLLVGVAAGFVLLAFLAVHDHLAERGAGRLSAVGVPFVVVGSMLFAFLPAMEIAMVGVRAAGADVEAVIVEMDAWFVPTLVLGGLVFGIGAVLYAVAIVRSRVLGTEMGWAVALALVVTSVARFIPFGAALYLMAAAMVVALVPLALAMREHPTTVGRTPGS